MISTGTIWGIRLTFGFPPVYMDHSCSSSSEGYVVGALARLESISNSNWQVVAILYMGIQTLYASYFVNVMLRCVFGHDWTELPNRTCVHLIDHAELTTLQTSPSQLVSLQENWFRSLLFGFCSSRLHLSTRAKCQLCSW